MSTTPDLRFLNGSACIESLLCCEQMLQSMMSYSVRFKHLKASVIGDVGIADGMGRVILFEKWLVDQFVENTSKTPYTIIGKTETPDYVSDHVVDLREQQEV